MKIKSIAGLAFLVTTLLFSCKRDKDSVPHVSVTPTPLYIIGNAGDLITFNIRVDSEVKLAKFYINQQPDNQVLVTVKDTVITTKGTSFTYYYRLPAALAGKSVIFEFKAEDENGNVGKELRRVFISNPTVTLTETTGHRMYSSLTTNPDAFDLEANVTQFSTSDSTTRDIQDNSGTDTTLSRTWISPAGGTFVLYNGYDYANATDVSLKDAYNGGVKLTLISGLAVNDIILTKLGSLSTDKYATIRITDIRDLPGKTNDYYEFSVKKQP
jgi:hypothetical protein